MNTEKISEKVDSIRHQLRNVTDEIPMTRAQMQTMDTISQRLWDLFLYLRKKEQDPK